MTWILRLNGAQRAWPGLAYFKIVWERYFYYGNIRRSWEKVLYEGEPGYQITVYTPGMYPGGIGGDNARSRTVFIGRRKPKELRGENESLIIWIGTIPILYKGEG